MYASMEILCLVSFQKVRLSRYQFELLRVYEGDHNHYLLLS